MASISINFNNNYFWHSSFLFLQQTFDIYAAIHAAFQLQRAVKHHYLKKWLNNKSLFIVQAINSKLNPYAAKQSSSRVQLQKSYQDQTPSEKGATHFRASLSISKKTSLIYLGAVFFH